jgi:hypothetical protein
MSALNARSSHHSVQYYVGNKIFIDSVTCKQLESILLRGLEAPHLPNPAELYNWAVSLPIVVLFLFSAREGGVASAHLL